MIKLYTIPIKQLIRRITFFVVLLLVFTGFACMQKRTVSSPPGYDLAAPAKYSLPSVLTEISGLAFYKGDPNTIYAHEDETGKLYHFAFGDADVNHVKFGGRGDYEDIAICKEQVIMLRSDGVLFIFPFKEVNAGQIDHVTTVTDILPKGEYESLYADEITGKLYIVCKNCSGEKKRKSTSGYIFNLAVNGAVTPAGNFSIDTKEIEAASGIGKLKFEPSALAKNINTNEWYVLSSVNKLLVVADANWQVKQAYRLNADLFMQPEGIAFDKYNNLYISNEGGMRSGTILKFIYKK